MNSTIDARLDAILNSAQKELGDNDWQFLNRVYRQASGVYRDRLNALDFNNRQHVLDAGCGFGQWSIALAELNSRVTGIDTAIVRTNMAGRIADTLGLENASFEVSGLEKLPFADATFDAIFCYGVVFLTDVERTLREFCRTLVPGGRLYVNANGLGWYVHLWLNSPNKATDHDPKKTVVDAFSNTYRQQNGLGRTSGHVILEKSELSDMLQATGFECIEIAAEGGINKTLNSENPVSVTPFFQGEYEGLIGVFEALAFKQTEK